MDVDVEYDRPCEKRASSMLATAGMGWKSFGNVRDLALRLRSRYQGLTPITPITPIMPLISPSPALSP